MRKSRMQRFINVGVAVGMCVALAASAWGCTAGSTTASGPGSKASTIKELTFAWEPGASEGKYENMRNLIAQAISDGAGINCTTMTTTDYNVCIEAVNSGKAQYASLGAKEYVELHKKNPAVQVAWVLSDGEGELDQVSYHSQILVLEENAGKYKQPDGSYKLTASDMENKNMSWVELSSTSGYVIPSISLANAFNVANSEFLGESGKFFDTVLFGGSHVNSLYNILTGDADFCAADDTGLANNYKVLEGKNGEMGALYEVKSDLEAPLDQYAGKKLRVVQSFPVPAVPFVVNTDYVTEEMQQNILAYMCSEAVSGNTQLFKSPKDNDTVTKWKQTTGKVRFVPAGDDYYDEFRKMIGEK